MSRLWDTGNFAQLCVSDAEICHQKCLSLSFISSSNNRCFGFFSDLSIAEFRIETSTVSFALEFKRVSHRNMSMNLGIGFCRVCLNVEVIYNDGEFLAFRHHTNAQSEMLSVIDCSDQRLKWTLLQIRDYLEYDFRYHTASFSGSSLFVVGKQITAEGRLPTILLWPHIDFDSNTSPLSVTLKGNHAQFVNGGRDIVAWTAWKDPVATQKVRVYRIRDAIKCCQPNCRPSKFKPFKTFKFTDGTSIYNAHLMLAGEEGVRTKLVLLADVPWSRNTKIIVLDFESEKLEREIHTRCPLKERFRQFPYSRARTRPSRPLVFTVSPNGQWIFISHANQQGGCLFSLKSGFQVIDLDWKERRDFDPVGFKFDPSGQFLATFSRDKLFVSVPLQLPSTIHHHGLPFNHQSDTLSTLEFLRLYDRAAFGRAIARGFALQDVDEGSALLPQNSVPDRIREKIENQAQGRVKHVVFSPDKRMVVFVISGWSRELEVWKLMPEEGGAQSVWTHCQTYCWKNELVDDTAGSSVGMFRTTSSGVLEFVLINAGIQGVHIIRVNTEDLKATEEQMSQSEDNHLLSCLKMTEDWRKAMAVFDSGEFQVIDLMKESEMVEATGRLSHPRDIDAFIEQFIEDCFLHITDDFKSLIIGWDFSRQGLVAVNLELSEEKMAAEIEREVMHLGSANLGMVPWVNKECTRAIVQCKWGPLQLLVYDITGNLPPSLSLQNSVLYL